MVEKGNLLQGTSACRTCRMIDEMKKKIPIWPPQFQ